MKRSIIIIICVFLLSASLWGQNVEFVGSALWAGANDVKVVGNNAYCAYASGLVILDIANLAEPVFMSRVFLEGEGYGIDVLGNYAY